MTATKNGAKTGNRETRRDGPQSDDATKDDSVAAAVEAGARATMAAFESGGRPAALAAAAAAGASVAAAAANAKTWKGWLPDDADEPAELITRDELIARLAAMGVEVNTANLRYWEYAGIVPRAVKRWHEGAVRAVYPPWMPYLVFTLRELQDIGSTLPTIARWLRSNFDRFVATNTVDDLNDPRAFASFFASGMIAPFVSDFAVRYHRMTGDRIRRVELSCTGTDPDGEPFVLPRLGVDIADDGAGP